MSNRQPISTFLGTLTMELSKLRFGVVGVALSLVAGFGLAEPARADLYVSGNHSTILRFDNCGNFIGQFNNGGNIVNGRGVVFGPDGNMYVSSFSTSDVQRFDGQTGDFIDVFASGGGLSGPWDLTFGPDGNLYVAKFQGDVYRYDGQTGAFIDVFATGAGAAGLRFGPDGNLYVGSFAFDSVKRYDGQSGAFIDDFVPVVNDAESLRFGLDGNLYVASRSSDAILRFDGQSGAFIDSFASGGGMSTPVDIEFGPDGNLYVAGALGAAGIYRYDGQTGAFLDVFASGKGINTPTHFVFFPLSQDSDNDGIPDDEDACPDSDLSETVVIDGCDSGVDNMLFEDGCTMADLIAQCAEGASNHGAFVSCVAHLTNEWKAAGFITGQEKAAIQSCAAQSNIPVGLSSVSGRAAAGCPADINFDGTIDVLDLIDVLVCFGQPAVPGCESEDLNGDGMVNVLDLIDLLLAFGTACP